MRAIAGSAAQARTGDIDKAKPIEELLGAIRELLDGAYGDDHRLEHAYERLERLERGQPGHDAAAE